jgi:hypothetical protein
MILTEINKFETLNTANGDSEIVLNIGFLQDDGIKGSISVLEPETWDDMTRPEKIAWVENLVSEHLTTTTYRDGTNTIYPDKAIKITARRSFDSLPNWATWTPQEAKDWVDTNVTDLAIAKEVLGDLAWAVLCLRDIILDK